MKHSLPGTTFFIGFFALKTVVNDWVMLGDFLGMLGYNGFPSSLLALSEELPREGRDPFP